MNYGKPKKERIMIWANAGVAFYFWELVYFFFVFANFGGNPACFPDDYTEIRSMGVLPVLTEHIAHPSLGPRVKFWGKSALCRVCIKLCKILIGAPQNSVQFDFIHATLVTSLIVLRCDGGKKISFSQDNSRQILPGGDAFASPRRHMTGARLFRLHVSQTCKSFSEAAPGFFWGDSYF